MENACGLKNFDASMIDKNKYRHLLLVHKLGFLQVIEKRVKFS